MTRPHLLPRLFALVALLGLPLGSPAQETAPAEITPATPAEVDYWRQLQARIAAFRSANSSLPTQIIDMSIPQLNEAMDRIEDFLDDRDQDEIADFGADLQDYHENLIGLFEAALPSLREAASFQEQANRINPMARMMAGAKAINLMGRVEDYKPALAKLHEQINARIVARGGPRIFFFQSLNLTDNSYVKGRRSDLTPQQRDEHFVAESRGIDPGLGTMAELHFVPLRQDGRSNAEINAIRDKLLELLQEFADSVQQLSNVQIKAELAKDPPPNADPLITARLGFALRQELVRRNRDSDAAFRLIDWKASFARWLGEARSTSAELACTDLAVSYDGARYAFSPDQHAVMVRSTENDEIVAQHEFEGEVRGLAFDFQDRLMAFTTQGLFRWDLIGGGQPYLRDNTTSPNITGAIATALERDRFFQAWAHIPGFSRGSLDSKLNAFGSSNITAVGMSRDGLFAAFGFSGIDNLGNGEKPKHGIGLVIMPESETVSEGLMVKSYQQAFIGPVTDIAFSDDASHFAFCLDTGEVLAFAREDEAKTRIQLTLDSQPYHFVTFLPGAEPLLLAAARNGVIRIWNYETKDLQQRFEVPTGPAGVAVGVESGVLFSVAIGAEEIHRWDLASGHHLATVVGTDPVIDADAWAATLAAEQELQPVIESLRRLYDFEGEEREAFARKLLAEEGDRIDRLGRRNTVVGSVTSQIADRIRDLNKADKQTEAVKIGETAIAEGFASKSVYYGTISGLLTLNRIKDANTLLEDGLQLYPTSSDLRFLYQWQRMQSARNAGNLEATLKAVDELDLVDPKNRPHTSQRIDAYTQIAQQKIAAGQQKAGLDLFVKALDQCRTKEQQLKLLPSIFSVAYQAKDWKLTVGVANMWMQVDPAKKNDAQFLEWARYAYSQANK
ncbi:hypothetical protein [Synoicihabitans lomoniglobus]|uniref:WD40 repeat domain-containing protein n=1 Tax=Synoicihabitans lomoniglobus TaxID=2909285 RepID=A0AAE9ZRF3_9BACT|nr:hypothetical protein [Opitutaceae bacterium LMO-M01]WED63870.1 hypothetical protein PXH66_16145 [Opitutaceae bacterium LMO-M01]